MSKAMHESAMMQRAERLLRTTRAYFAADLDELLRRRQKPRRLRGLAKLLRDSAEWGGWGARFTRGERRRRPRRPHARGQSWVPV
jgi:hypothetical protein